MYKGGFYHYFDAKETVLRDNRELKRLIRDLRQENRELSAYIKGLELGLRAVRRSKEA